MASPRDHRRVAIALVQMACTASKTDTVKKALRQIEDAAARGAQIVCLQELFHGIGRPQAFTAFNSLDADWPFTQAGRC